MKKMIRLTLIAMALSLGACATTVPGGGERAQRPEDVGLSTERLQRLTARMQEGIAKGEYPGAVLVIGRQGKVAYSQTFGVLNPDTGVPMREDALFRIASMTKPFASLAIMMLSEKGKLSIVDRVDKYLPELNEHSADALYGDAMQALLKMQLQITCDDLPAYDENRLVAEMELMPEWFLQRHLAYTPSCGEWDVIEPAFRCLINNAKMQVQTFVHRDYHSRNLLILDDNNPGILDFQDAVKGPITYDLVSLLRDCYIAWPEQRITTWVENYRLECVKAGLTNVDTATFKRGFDLMGLQRHLKVLGIFCRLWYRDGKAGYLNDLPLVWQYTRDVGLRYPETAPLIELLERVIGERDIRLPLA